MKAYVPENPFKYKSYTHVALLDRYAQQVQGVGKTKEAALREALTCTVEGLPKTVEAIEEDDNQSGDPRFGFVLVTAAQAAALDDEPGWEYAALNCYAPSAS